MSFLKDRINKRQQTHEKGYVSFTEEDLNEAKVNHQINAEAYSLLDAAMHTSSHITEEDKNGDTVEIDDIYPCSEAECDEMDALLDKAEKVVKDKNDDLFKSRLSELRGIVSWSREKHWNFQWSLILGCVLSVLGMMYVYSDSKTDAGRRETELQQVKNWAERDTTIAYELCSSDWMIESKDDAPSHKAARLSNIKYRISNCESSIAEYQSRLDTCTTKSQIKSYKKLIENSEDTKKKYRKQYDEVNDMKFKKYQKMILKESTASAKSAKKHAFFMWIFFIYLIILIPAYIYYSHQYGYYITRHRTEAKVLGGIQKVAFAVASFFLGAGLAMSLLPDMEVTTVYSNGTSDTHTESNSANIAIMAIKLFMVCIGLFIFAITSVFIMTYATVAAIKRTYDWSKVAAVTAAATQKTMDMVKESGVADKAIEAAKNATEKATKVTKETVDKVQDKMKK